MYALNKVIKKKKKKVLKFMRCLFVMHLGVNHTISIPTQDPKTREKAKKTHTHK